jgi:uncharacterized membrane protein YkvA (DUF1232 family)
MLKVLDDQLRSLANLKDDDFRRAIAARLNGKATEDQVKSVKEFIFLMPPVLKQLTNYWNEKKTPAEAKRLSGFIVTYIFHPDNLISLENNGLFGYIDDAYLVVATFLRMEEMALKDWRAKSSAELELWERCRAHLAAPKLVIPDEVARIDEMIDSIIQGKSSQITELTLNRDSQTMSTPR